jgi:hypothetical protein
LIVVARLKPNARIPWRIPQHIRESSECQRLQAPLLSKHPGNIEQTPANSLSLQVLTNGELPDVQVLMEDFRCQKADDILILTDRDPFCSQRDIALVSFDRDILLSCEPRKIRNRKKASACGKLDGGVTWPRLPSRRTELLQSSLSLIDRLCGAVTCQCRPGNPPIYFRVYGCRRQLAAAG